MCAVDDAEPWTVSREETPRARKQWRCGECGRGILPGERYHLLVGLSGGIWHKHRWCAHCNAAGIWLAIACGGYPTGMLREELIEHWNEGYRSLPFARLIAGQRRGWHEGRDPIPTGVSELAQAMLREQVAS